MTTTVIVKTHDWPARVSGFEMEDGKPKAGATYEEIGVVPAFSEATFHPHAHLDILVQELPLPAPSSEEKQ